MPNFGVMACVGPAHDTFVCCQKITYQQSITADTLKVLANGDLLIVIIGLKLSVSLCPKVITFFS